MADKTQVPAAADEPQRYEEIVQRLGRIVERLEGGGLSLEEAIGAFEEGIGLARAGSARLDEAERRVELLLESGRTQPFDAVKTEAAPARPAFARSRGTPAVGVPGDDDIPL